MTKHQPIINLSEVLKAFAWLDVYLDNIQLEVGVHDLYQSVYGLELPSIQIDISNGEPMLLFDLCETLEENGYGDLVHEFFTLLMEQSIEVTSWRIDELSNRKTK